MRDVSEIRQREEDDGGVRMSLGEHLDELRVRLDDCDTGQKVLNGTLVVPVDVLTPADLPAKFRAQVLAQAQPV